jgi:hypothetical protein
MKDEISQVRRRPRRRYANCQQRQSARLLTDHFADGR